MKGKDIFLGLRYIGDDLIEEAEYGEFVPAGRRMLRRPILLAALIALMLLLIGCTVVYALRSRNLNLGTREVTYDAYDYDTMEFLGKETYEEEVLTVAGLKGSAEYLAALEWFEFLQSYDQDRSIQGAVWGNYPEFPEAYSSYGLYSQDMKDALDAILEKYNLLPMGAPLEFRTTRNLCAALGIERLQTARNDVTIRIKDGGCYENGNFYLDLDIQLPEGAENELDASWGTLCWNRRDCFSDQVIALQDAQTWREWNYTTADGSEVLILRSEDDWRGYILCSRPEGLLTLRLETRRDLWNSEGGRTWAEELYLTDRQLEQIADAVDFGIQPRKATREDVDNQPPIAQALTQDGYTLGLKALETDGWVVRILMSVTAPEGTVISRNPHPGFEDQTYYIEPGNWDNFLCQTGQEVGSGGTWNLVDDGDGRDHTQDILMVRSAEMADGGAPFGLGMTWNLFFADLTGSYWDDSYTTHVDILAEGEWLFPITFDGSMGNYRERELVAEPVTVGASAGWRPDGSDVVEQVTVTSFRLRSYSASIVHTGPEGTDFSWLNGEFLRVVLEDGTQLQLAGSNGIYEAEGPIDLDRVSHILFADGTRLDVGQPDTESAVEFLTEPVEVDFYAGYAEDAYGNRENLYETMTLTSVSVYPTGAVIRGYAGMTTRESVLQAVMEDGTGIALYGSSGGPDQEGSPCSRLEAERVLDVEQIACLRFPDGTVVYAP